MSIGQPLSQTEIMHYIDSHSLTLKKRWGQNFFIDRGLCEHIVADAIDDTCATIVEIGAGFGALTHWILRHNRQAICVEIDYGIARILAQRYPQLTIHTGDDTLHGAVLKHRPLLVIGNALHIIPALLDSLSHPALVIGSLPYRSAAKILTMLAVHSRQPHRIACIIQHEIVERIIAQPNNAHYSSFSVTMGVAYTLVTRMPIHQMAFYPRPYVDSEYIILTRREAGTHSALGRYEPIIRSLFAARRATLWNNLRRGGYVSAAHLQRILHAGHIAGSSIGDRVEHITPQQCLAVAKEIFRLKQEARL